MPPLEWTVRLFAILRERYGADQVICGGLDAGATLAELKLRLVSEHPELGDLSHVAGVVGTEYVLDDHVLQPGDQVALLPPVSGGSLDGDFLRGLFELCAEPLDPGDAWRRVSHPSCGAVVVFTGITRDTNRGEQVVQLDYEAFEAMTEPEMQRIFQRCMDAHAEAELRMLCQHRTGVVEVGQPSVVVAVASAHRDPAFRAARFLIDTLKESLPVWKKEVYRAGHHWIGERS